MTMLVQLNGEKTGSKQKLMAEVKKMSALVTAI